MADGFTVAHRSQESLEATVRRLADELRRSETRFRDVIERNADAIVVIDAKGLIAFANRVAVDLFAKPSNELLGHPFGFPAVAGETTELDLLRNGSTIVIEMRVVESEWEGQPACIATLRDATDRKRAEESARRLIAERSARAAADKAAERFRFLADASSALGGSLDHRAMFSLLPRLCCNGLADWTVVYRVENGVIHRVDAAHRNERLASVLQQMRSDPGVTALTAVDDVVRTHDPLLVENVDAQWLDAHVPDPGNRGHINTLGLTSLMIVPLIARDNVLGAIALASTDPDRHFDAEDLALAQDFATRAGLALDNARLYNDAKEANQTKTDFLAVISHDLRTPLNAILGYAELLSMGIPDKLSAETSQSIERIRTSAGHLVYLIDELLAYARLDSHHEAVQPTNVDVHQLADEVSAVIQPLADARGLRFHLELPDQPLTLHTDADKLRQVLLNLLSNGLKYTESGEVRMSAQRQKDDVVFVVSDSGIGIAEQHLQRIFEPFWQVNTTPRGPTNGTGLGLSVVRQLVELLGGEISVESVPGDGSTFTIRLPVRFPVALLPDGSETEHLPQEPSRM